MRRPGRAFWRLRGYNVASPLLRPIFRNKRGLSHA